MHQVEHRQGLVVTLLRYRPLSRQITLGLTSPRPIKDDMGPVRPEMQDLLALS